MTIPATWTLSVRDFRVLRNVEWSPNGVCLLAGPNGAGKTSLLEALDFLRSSYLRGVSEAVRLLGGGAFLRRRGAEPRAAVHLALSMGDLRWELDLPVEGVGVHLNHGEVLKKAGNVPLRRAMYSPELFLGAERREADERCGLRVLWDVLRPPEIEPLVNLIGGIRLYDSYWLNQVREPQSGADTDQFLHRTGKNVWTVLRNWKSSPKRYRDQFAWVLKALRNAFPDIIQDMEFDAVGQTVQGRFYPPGTETADDSLPMHLAADGLLVGILHLTAIAGAKEGSVLAFDEMENQLHPHAIRSILASMREIAEERNLTIVLTTHSPVLMNEFKGHEGQFYVLEAGHDELPIPLDKARDPEWLAHFSLGDLYDREDFGAPTPTGR